MTLHLNYCTVGDHSRSFFFSSASKFRKWIPRNYSGFLKKIYSEKSPNGDMTIYGKGALPQYIWRRCPHRPAPSSFYIYAMHACTYMQAI